MHLRLCKKKRLNVRAMKIERKGHNGAIHIAKREKILLVNISIWFTCKHVSTIEYVKTTVPVIEATKRENYWENFKGLLPSWHDFRFCLEVGRAYKINR